MLPHIQLAATSSWRFSVHRILFPDYIIKLASTSKF